MKLVELNVMHTAGDQVAVFQGREHAAGISFFYVRFSRGHGPRKHRHPYEETFILLEGEIEATVGEETALIPAPKIVIVPADTWHEFRGASEAPAVLVTIHPVPNMTTEWA